MNRNLAIVLAIAAKCSASAVATEATNTAPAGVILISPLGRAVTMATNDVPAGFLPPADVGINAQLPTPARGYTVPNIIRERQEDLRAGQKEFSFFPDSQPLLMPYLGAQDEYGNTAIRPGPVFPSTPLDIAVQQGKYWFSEGGFRYSFAQSLTWVSLTDVMQGDNTLGFYTLSFGSKWNVFDAPAAGSAGWISSQISAKTGLGASGDTQSAQRNLGSATDPTGIWSSVNGFRIPELAWQESLRDGEVVVVAGMVNQANYLDGNAYANSGRGQFLNSALINSMIVPLAAYNFGANLQWQPADEWYSMLGYSVGNGQAGVVPWTDFTWSNWLLVGEVGYAPKDFLGMGPGVYRVQPFVGQPEGASAQGGFGLNFQQQLGRQSPFAWFGRFGSGGSGRFQSETTTTASGSQLGTGFAMKGPLEYIGLCPSRANDGAGIGFVWSHPTTTEVTPYHANEHVLEAGYVLQLTPTAKIQPDFQVVWNPIANPSAGPAMVFQLQLDLAW